jgi:signal transduction histidine kinase
VRWSELIASRFPRARISYFVYLSIALLVGVVVWLAGGRYTLVGAIDDDFTSLQGVSRTSRLAVEVSERLAALTSGIREYVASNEIDPPAVVAEDARALLRTVEGSRQILPRDRFEIERVEAEVRAYLDSFAAVVATRAERGLRLKRLAAAAGELRDAAEAAGETVRFLKIREAELQYLLARNDPAVDVVLRQTDALTGSLKGQKGMDTALGYRVAFSRVAEVYSVLDRATLRVLDDHDKRLRGFTVVLAERARIGEEFAAASFKKTLADSVRNNVWVLIAALLITFALAFVLLRFVIHPLNQLTGAMTDIADGKYARPIPYMTRRDEVGQLAVALSTFKNALLGLKAAQGQAEMASRHKSDFLANMSHELRTPLNAIIGLSSMLLEDADDPQPDELRASLSRIISSAKHLLGLINDILDLSKIEAGRMNVNIDPFSPATLAEESLATVTAMAREKELAITSDYAPSLPTLESDPQRTRQILINLLGNAIKFTDVGEVRLSVAASGGTVTFAVIDTGPGISREDLPRLFQEFTQLDASRTRKFGGTGLGLALSRRMARVLGGDIIAQSEPGQGSIFTLTLPLRAPQSQATEARAKIRQLDPSAPVALPATSPANPPA